MNFFFSENGPSFYSNDSSAINVDQTKPTVLPGRHHFSHDSQTDTATSNAGAATDSDETASRPAVRLVPASDDSDQPTTTRHGPTVDGEAAETAPATVVKATVSGATLDDESTTAAAATTDHPSKTAADTGRTTEGGEASTTATDDCLEATTSDVGSAGAG